MPDLLTTLAVVYLIGFVLGLIRVDEPFPGRMLVAAAWPLGPLAFVGVVTILLLALPIAMPRAAAVLALTAAAVGWLLYQAVS
jgi:hypothetical protein